MRVVHLACVAPPETGGIGSAAAMESALLRERGIDSTVLVPARKGMGKVLGIERLRSVIALGHGALLKEADVVEHVQGADVVHLHYPFHGTDVLVARLRRKGSIRRLVITHHMDADAAGLKGVVFAIYRAMFQRRIYQVADAVCVTSMDYASNCSLRGFVGSVGAPPVYELPFGVDTERFHPPEMPAKKNTVLFVGGMDTPHAFKGVDVLLHAIRSLPDDVTCTLVGDGDLRHTYERLAEILGISNRVRFLGRVTDEELPNIYRSSSLFVFPSTTVAEAFGLVALEAQASGLPVVASDLPGVRTVVRQDETGILVTPNDPLALAEGIAKVLADETWRMRLGERARERVVKEYAWASHIDTLIKIYTRLCE